MSRDDGRISDDTSHVCNDVRVTGTAVMCDVYTDIKCMMFGHKNSRNILFALNV